MKFLLIALLVVAAFCEPLTEENYNFLFSKFQEQYNRNYRPEEQALRFSLFKSNLDRIKAHNARTDVSFKTGINQFSDWTRDEYLSILPNMPLQYSDAPVWDNEEAPTAATVDWRQKGAVTPVKDQGQCGSCWSFSTTGTMEGRDFIDTGILNSYSESMIVDCDGDCYGCNGCWPYLALEWVQNQGGDCAEIDYPYHAVQETCKKTQCKKKGTCTGHINIKAQSEAALATAVEQNGPISVAIDASHWSFQQYKSGVYYEASCSSTQLDHAVLCVGYGVDNGDNYWIVKNSWNTSWGNEGYIWMAKDRSNNCGIATSAVYPNTCKNL
ncbi:cysteine proteinase [Anaeramoeba flamelloides]|uniref:Cysteine proteinase n=1 Tax=Anaeramoeba flamelloides TaxID=1746091 RepID=A0AAV7Z5S8_9EUKA|nr:cysteine proteinase [Anaeramoeba flamelloides]